MEYKHINIQDYGGVGYFVVTNKKSGDEIGHIRMDHKWRCWTFNPDQDCKFSADCLRDIAGYLELKDKENKG